MVSKKNKGVIKMNHLRRPVSLLLALLMMLSVFDSSLSSVFATGIEDSEILSEIEEDTEVVDESLEDSSDKSLEDSSDENFNDADEESLVEEVLGEADEGENDVGEDNDDEPVPTFTQLYRDIKDLDKIDFSTKQLLVGTNDISIFTWDTTVLSEYNGVYLLQFNTVDETKSAYTYYSDKADFVDANIVVYAADDSYIGGTSVDDVNMGDDAISILASLSEKDKTGSANIALIDTGADKANESVSVIGSDVKDDNGHGNAMFAAIVSTEEDVSVLSIKALDKNGTGTLASIYAGIEYAVYCGVDVINLSVEAKSTLKSDVLNSALKDAKNAGILVVGSAGNDGSNIKDYLFGDLDNIYVIGASQEDGTTRADSNYGDAVDYSVVAGSTSEAAAKFSALIAVHGIDYVNEILNQGLVYGVGYEPKEDNNIIEASDEKDSEGQAVSSEGNDDSENPEVPEVPENVDEQQEDDESTVIYDDLIEVKPSNNSPL